MGLLLTLLLGLFIIIGAIVVFVTKNNNKFVQFSISLAFGVIAMLIVGHLLPEAFEVIDTGNGIDKKDIKYIWDKYYKVDKKYKRVNYGTGLGLSIVKNVLELHKFNYGVDSKKGSGTKFYFDIKNAKI